MPSYFHVRIRRLSHADSNVNVCTLHLEHFSVSARRQSYLNRVFSPAPNELGSRCAVRYHSCIHYTIANSFQGSFISHSFNMILLSPGNATGPLLPAHPLRSPSFFIPESSHLCDHRCSAARCKHDNGLNVALILYPSS